MTDLPDVSEILNILRRIIYSQKDEMKRLEKKIDRIWQAIETRDMDLMDQIHEAYFVTNTTKDHSMALKFISPGENNDSQVDGEGDETGSQSDSSTDDGDG